MPLKQSNHSSLPTPLPPLWILLSVSVVVNASRFFASSPTPLSSTVAQTFSFFRSVETVTTTRPDVETASPNRAWVEWMALLMASKRGCMAPATFVGFGSRSMRFTRLGRSEVIDLHSASR